MPAIRYDSSGNIRSLQRYGNSQSMMDNLSYSYTAGTNRLASITNSVGSATQTYTYDANGNATSDSYRGIAFIIYDINNLPVTVYKTSGAIVQYYYDAIGNRIQKYDGSANTWYVQGADGKTEVITTATTTAPTYTMDNAGQILRNGSTLTRYYYLKDHLGSIKMMVDASGNVQSYNDYYPYGMTMLGRSGVNGADTRFRFTGKERDVESGFDYFGARYYDSRIARWMSVDPLAPLHSNYTPFAYCYNNPIRLIDLFGLDTTLTNNKGEKQRELSPIICIGDNSKVSTVVIYYDDNGAVIVDPLINAYLKRNNVETTLGQSKEAIINALFAFLGEANEILSAPHDLVGIAKNVRDANNDNSIFYNTAQGHKIMSIDKVDITGKSKTWNLIYP